MFGNVRLCFRTIYNTNKPTIWSSDVRHCFRKKHKTNKLTEEIGPMFGNEMKLFQQNKQGFDQGFDQHLGLV